jgi:hypothetical protein
VALTSNKRSAPANAARKVSGAREVGTTNTHPARDEIRERRRRTRLENEVLGRRRRERELGGSPRELARSAGDD